ncbi:MAG: hypothetical protein AUH40_10435 [Chloroflexi bacterium 13_1_40CM_65_17]|nr:MAG: hypothetical protein AUH40_10435 [Chloroflexi bacterium 13_1_40CM_65_17]
MSRPGALWVILRSQLVAQRNRLFKRNRAGLIAVTLVTLLFGGFAAGGIFSVGATAGHFLTSSVDPLLSATVTALSLLMLLLGFPTVIASLFVGRDLLQLVVAPVRTRDIFFARLLLAMNANLLISAIFAAGVVGVGIGAGAQPVYYPTALLLIAAQVVAVTSLQAILMTVIARWVPARLARDVAAGVAGLTGVGLYLAWNLSLRQTFGRRGRPDVSSLTSFVRPIDWLPTTWPAHALSAVVAGSIGTALFWSLATLAFAAVLLTMAGLLYERTLLSGLGIFGGAAVVWRRRVERPIRPGRARGAGSPALAIARKDWLGFRRDVRRLTRLLPAVLLPLGWVVAFSQQGRILSGFWSSVALVTFLSIFMSSALALPSIPGERRGFQLLRMAPLTMWQVLRAKVLTALPPVLAIILVFSAVVVLTGKDGPGQLLELLILGLWLAVGFVSISVSGGAIDPRFDATDDRRSVGVLGSLVSLAASLAFSVLSIGALALFVFGAQATTGTIDIGPIISTPELGVAMLGGGVMLVAAAGVLVGSALWIANARLRSFEGTIAAT